MVRQLLGYLWYLARHKYYVFIEACKLGAPFRGFFHDLSKFLPDEFFPYLQWFYDKKGIRWEGRWFDADHWKCGEKFRVAWLKHIHRNKHHWQYWVLHQDDGSTICIDIPMRIRKEMLADWGGGGKAITGKDNTLEWYFENKSKMMLNDDVELWIEEQLKE